MRHRDLAHLASSGRPVATSTNISVSPVSTVARGLVWPGTRIPAHGHLLMRTFRYLPNESDVIHRRQQSPERRQPASEAGER